MSMEANLLYDLLKGDNLSFHVDINLSASLKHLKLILMTAKCPWKWLFKV